MPLGLCDGSRPWLGPYTKEPCGEPNRLLIRTASNAYFPQLMSVISLPDRDETVKQAVDAAWEYLEAVEDLERAPVRAEESQGQAGPGRHQRRGGLRRDPGPARRRREGGEDGQARGAGNPDRQQGRDRRRPAGRRLLRAGAARDRLGHALDEADRAGRPGASAARSRRPGRLHALRGGGTRHRRRAGDRRPAGAAGPRNLLAAGRREQGRGRLPPVQGRRPSRTGSSGRTCIERGRQLEAGFECWQAEHQGTQREFSGLPYLMLHSFSHLLITAVALECGYPASSIRERIYALPEHRLRRPALHRHLRRRRDAGRPDPGRPTDPRAHPRAPWNSASSAPTTRSAPSTSRRTPTSGGSCTARPATAAC